MTHRFILVLGGLVLAALLIGCAKEKRPDGIPQQFPTTVTVLQEGVPLAGATVAFMAADEGSVNSRWAIDGTTDSSGKAQMAVNGRYKGSPAGKFKVMVIKFEKEKPVEIPPAPDPAKDPLEYAAWRKQYNIDGPGDGTPPKTWTLVDKKYSRFETSPLEVEVLPTPNDLKIDVGKAIRVLDKFTPAR